MAKKRFSVEQIISHLREAEVFLAQGQTIGGAVLIRTAPDWPGMPAYRPPAPETVIPGSPDQVFVQWGLRPDQTFPRHRV